MARGLTPEQRAERMNGIGGSDAGKIASGDWLPLWEIKTGARDDEDLTWVLPVQMGIVTEELNIDFFEHATGHQVFGRGEVYRHPDYDFIRCTLDGLVLIGQSPAIVQCKHVSAFASIDEVEQRYTPQVMHEMFVTGAVRAFLSVLMGTLKHEIVEFKRDSDYIRQLVEMERAFWNCVTSREPPIQSTPLATPLKPEVYRTVCFEGSNEWTVNAVDWIETNTATKKNAAAAKALRAMVEADVGLAHGAGVEIKRAKDGKALYLREARA